jgi:DNA invertase Pin-like site-specific DNA recombinase
VSGADPVHERPGFAAMLARIESNGVRAVLVETSSRFARDILVQETGWRFLRERGIDLIASDSPGAFLDETPTAIMIRQLLGVISEFEKASLVAKLRGARERKKRETGKCEGRKGLAELRPDVVALARELRRRRPKPTLRAIATELASRGHLASSGKPFEASVVARMLRAYRPQSAPIARRQPDPVAKDRN